MLCKLLASPTGKLCFLHCCLPSGLKSPSLVHGGCSNRCCLMGMEVAWGTRPPGWAGPLGQMVAMSDGRMSFNPPVTLSTVVPPPPSPCSCVLSSIGPSQPVMAARPPSNIQGEPSEIAAGRKITTSPEGTQALLQADIAAVYGQDPD